MFFPQHRKANGDSQYEEKEHHNKAWNKIGFKGEWAQTLKKYLERQQDEVPPGWLRTEAAVKAMGFKSNHSGGSTNKLINAMVREGVLMKKEFRVFDNSGRRISSITHYKIA